MKTILLFSLGLTMAPSFASAANVVVNGDFTANASSFIAPGSFGYYGDIIPSSNPLTPTNWARPLPGNGGVNGAGTGFTTFGPANGGGLTYAFVQNGVGLLSQTLSGDYAVNTVWTLSFDAAARSGNTTVDFRVQVGDTTQMHFSTQTANGGVELRASDAAFVRYTYTFTSPATFDGVPSIQLYNVSAPGDTTALFANVSLQPVPEPTAAAFLALSGLALVRRRR